QYLGRGEFTPQPGELLATLVQPPPITLPHIEGTEKIGMYAVADGQAVRSPYAKIQPVEHLHYLKEKVALGWIADCEQHPVLATTRHLLQPQIESVVLVAALEQEQYLGNPRRWGDPDIFLVIQPENPEKPVKILHVKGGKIVAQFAADPPSDPRRDNYTLPGHDLLIALAIEFEPLDLEGPVETRQRSGRVGNDCIGNLVLIHPAQCLVK